MTFRISTGPARALVAAVLAWASMPSQAVLATGAELQPARAVASPAVPSRAVVFPVTAVRLEAPAPAELVAANAQGASGRAQIGFPRSVTPLRTASDVSRQLVWAPLGAGRQAAAVSITSPGAAGLRIALRTAGVPRGSRFRFFSATAIAAEIDAADVEASIARNVYYGDDGPAAHLYWSPVIDGDTAVLEIDLPPGASANELRLAVPLLSHLVSAASDGFTAACAPGACDDVSGAGDGSAVVRVLFTDAGATFACNGMLLADRDPETVIPYFLMSRHCIASQSAASTLQPYWPAGGNACAGGAAVKLDAGEQGATMLHADDGADLTLLRLLKAPPPGATYAGWVVGSPPTVHAANASDLVKVGLADHGVAQAGNGPQARLGECGAGTSISARFESAYNAGLYQWLGGTPQDAAETVGNTLPGGS